MVDKYHPEQAILLCTRTADVADPDPGSGAFLTPRWVKNQYPDLGSRSRMNTHHIFESLETIFGDLKKMYTFFDADPGWNKFGSGVKDA